MHFLGNRQVNGLIIDGYTRDKATIEEMGIPQFTKGISIAPVPRKLPGNGEGCQRSRFLRRRGGQPGRLPFW